MMKNINFKNFFPHITAILIFIVLSLVYFYPLLEGYTLRQGDVEKHKAMGHEIKSHKEKYNETALWSGNMFAGMPTYLTTRVKYSLNITHYILALAKAGLPHPASAIFVYLLGFFILFLCLRINPWLAIIGSIAFAFSSYFLIIIEAGHTSKTYAIAFMAPVLGGFIEAMRGKLSVGVLLIAVFTSVQLYVNHLQITYYLFFVLLFVGIAELGYAVKTRTVQSFLKKISFVLLGAILGVLPNLGNLLITYEYSKQSTRGKTELTISADGSSNESNVSSGLDKDYITQWSYGIDETFTLIVPDAKGGSSIPILGDEEEVKRLRKEDPNFFNVLASEYQQNNYAVPYYFGNQPIVSGPVYIGIIVVVLALLALIFLRDRLVLALAGVTLLTVALSWGKNFMGLTEFFIDYVPGYNKFRAVAMILVVAEFTAPILAILFLDRLIKEREVFIREKKKVFIGLGAIALIVAGIALSPDSFVDLSSEVENARLQQQGANSQAAFLNQSRIEDYRAAMVSQSAWGSFRYLALASILLLLFIFGKIKKGVLLSGIGALIFIDLWLVDKQYLNNKKANGRSATGTKYENWVKPSNQQIPYDPNSIDQSIIRNELANDPSLSEKIQNRIDTYKKENGKRLDNRKVFDLQYAGLMEHTHYRVLNTNDRLDQEVRTPFFHKSLGGYHGAKMKKYQELIDFHLGIEHYQVRQAFVQAGPDYVRRILPTLKTANMLNAKYIVGPDNTGKSQGVVIENPHAYGNAWFVNQIRVVENADSAIAALRNNDLRTTAVVEKVDASNLGNETYNPSGAEISLQTYSPNKLTYQYSAYSKQFAVFSEIYYSPGWKAYINGEEAEFNKVNYTLRGMILPSGGGTIEFIFQPFTYKLGSALAGVSSLIMILLLGFISYRGFKDK